MQTGMVTGCVCPSNDTVIGRKSVDGWSAACNGCVSDWGVACNGCVSDWSVACNGCVSDWNLAYNGCLIGV